MEAGFKAKSLVLNTFVCTASGGGIGVMAASGDWASAAALLLSGSLSFIAAYMTLLPIEGT